MTNAKYIQRFCSFNRFNKTDMSGITRTEMNSELRTGNNKFLFRYEPKGKSLNTMHYLNIPTSIKQLVLLTFAMFVFGITPLTAQEQDSIVINGTIVNGSNEPVQNVSVAVEGSFNLPAVTDENGNFRVVASSTSDWLNIEPTENYKPQRVFLNNRQELKIFLTNSGLESGDDVLNILS